MGLLSQLSNNLPSNLDTYRKRHKRQLLLGVQEFKLEDLFVNTKSSSKKSGGAV